MDEDSMQTERLSLITTYFRSKSDPLTIKNVAKHTKIQKKYVKTAVKRNPNIFARAHPIECGNGKFMSLKNANKIMDNSIWKLKNHKDTPFK